VGGRKALKGKSIATFPAILLARTLGYVETFDLNPRGKVFFSPDVVQEIVQRYKFQKFPKDD